MIILKVHEYCMELRQKSRDVGARCHHVKIKACIITQIAIFYLKSIPIHQESIAPTLNQADGVKSSVIIEVGSPDD